MSRDILRNPPRVIDPDQRIKYGVVQALVGMAECALADLIQLLEGMIDEENDATLSDDQVNLALTLAWSIVDQADLL